MSKDNEVPNIYIIPDNFVDEGRVINGLFKTRNFAEGTALAVAAFGICSLFNFSNIIATMMIDVIVALPLFLLGVAGVNNDPLSKWLINLFRWRKQKQLMLYNGHIKEKSEADDNIFFAESRKDKLLKKLKGNQFKDSEEKENMVLVEGIDFVFKDEKTKLKAPSAISIGGKKGKFSKSTDEHGMSGFKLSFINPEDDDDDIDLSVFLGDDEFLQTDDFDEQESDTWLSDDLIFTDEDEDGELL